MIPGRGMKPNTCTRGCDLTLQSEFRRTMSLDIEKRDREGVAILDLRGRITMGEEVTSFRQTIQALARNGSAKVVLNMAHVDYIDSTGLGAIVWGSSAVRNAGGVVKLLNLNRRNVELLVATKLTTIFD